LRPYLEYQADRVEAVLAAHKTPGKIVGGTVGPQLIRFFLQPAPHIRFASIERLADDLALAMQVPTLSIDRGKEGVILEFSNPQPRPVTLLNLLPEVMPMPIGATLLGLCDDGAPLLARLSAPEVAHILVTGMSGAGKSALLRTIAASLALTHTPSLLQMVCIDLQSRTFAAFGGLPHLARQPIANAAEAVEALRSIARVMASRNRRGESPAVQEDALVLRRMDVYGTSLARLVVLVDGLHELTMRGGAPLRDVLLALIREGRPVGVHVIAALQQPEEGIADFPLRLVGRAASADEARLAAGQPGTNAHLLSKRGDFLAVGGDAKPVRFQTAYIDERDLVQQMRMLSAGGAVAMFKSSVTDLDVYAAA
jgi:S-DNA-T family DNA segregation ATPase FtsK/SpoIIIE